MSIDMGTDAFISFLVDLFSKAQSSTVMNACAASVWTGDYVWIEHCAESGTQSQTFINIDTSYRNWSAI